MQAVILCCAFLFSLSLINAFVLRLPSKSSQLVCGFKISDREKITSTTTKSIAKRTNRNKTILRDILGLGSCNSKVFLSKFFGNIFFLTGPAEIAITLVVGLVLFGPETLKSLSKDVGRAAAELKELPKTFKEGMEEGQESAQVSRMKAIAAEKRKKRDEKLASAGAAESSDVDDEEDS